MNRRESVEFVNMCMIKNGDKVLVQDRVSPNWPGITFPILLVIFLPRLTFAWSDQRRTAFRDSWY